jgi:NADH-ubiquinone oxidoreductase chain 5
MAAPTPTRALVHRSTLVTAGILLVVKMHLLTLTLSSLTVILWLGLLTIFVAGISALVEFDIKKLVALSTLSQMGLRIATVGCGLPYLGILHLISHGFIKRLLFLQVGYLMHKLHGGQDSRG